MNCLRGEPVPQTTRGLPSSKPKSRTKKAMLSALLDKGNNHALNLHTAIRPH